MMCGHGIHCTECYIKVRLLPSRDTIVMVLFVCIRDSISYIHFHLLKEREGMALKP